MFWLATLNPGRRSKRRRKLSAWQRMVKRHGGVKGAIAARRKLRAGSRKARRKSRGRRRLSAWQRMVRKYGGVKAALKHRRKAKSAISRRKSRRRRAGRHHVRRNGMARSRRGRRRASRRRRNPLFRRLRTTDRRRRRRGQFSGRSGRRLHQIRPGGLGWHNNPRRRRNPVLPTSWNPRRRRSHRRRYRRNAVLTTSWNPRRRYRRNSVIPVSWNPARTISAAPQAILGRLKEFVDIKFWTETAIPAVGGFVGSKTLGAVVFDLANTNVLKLDPASTTGKIARLASNGLAGSALAFAVERFLPIGNRRKIADGIWTGVAVSVAHDALRLILGGTEIARVIGLDGMGNDVSSRMRDAIRRRMAVNGVGTYMTYGPATRLQGLNEFVTDRELRAQNGYAPTPGGRMADYDIHAPTEIA